MTSIAGMAFANDGARNGRAVSLFRYRELIWMLAWRDIRVRYKHSVLGAAWAVIPAVLMMGIFTFVFRTVNPIDPRGLTGHETLPYSLFALSGLVPWTFFANALTSATLCLVSNRQLITKIYFPREVFPVASILSALVDFVIGGAALLTYAVILHYTSGWQLKFHPAIAALPVVIAVQLALMTGLSLILSMANLFYRDVAFLFRSLIQLWMFLTCVVYQLEATAGWKRVVVQLNPMTPIIRAFRDCLILGKWPFDLPFLGAATTSLGTLALAWIWFGRRESKFAEYI